LAKRGSLGHIRLVKQLLRLLVVVQIACVVAVVWPIGASAGPVKQLPTLPLSVKVVSVDGKTVVSKEWMKQQVSEANRLMRPHGLTVAVARTKTLPAKLAQLDTPADRDGLARRVDKQQINVFFVKKLRDIHRTKRFIQGVHWRLTRKLSVRYVIIAANATPTTLAHELGHFFGNGHSKVDNNIMSYTRSDVTKVRFDRRQGAKMRRVGRRLLRAKWLLPFAKKSR